MSSNRRQKSSRKSDSVPLKLKETRMICYISCACFNDIVLQSGRMVPHKPVFDANAQALHDHMQYFTVGRISIGSAEDWQLHPDFNDSSYELEHQVVTGKRRVILADWDDTNLATPLFDLSLWSVWEKQTLTGVRIWHETNLATALLRLSLR